MDIFNRKKVEQLKRDLDNERDKNRKLNNELCDLKRLYDQASDLSESIPEDCIKGPWCKACNFVKTFNYIDCYGHDLSITHTICVCGKGESCKSFVPRESDA